MLSFVVDTNVLITFFWKDSSTRKLFLAHKFVLFSPEYALEEIKKYSSEIKAKTGITEKEFIKIREDLANIITFVSIGEYKDYLKHAQEINDQKDIDFMALALKLKTPLWSNDKELKTQSLVRVFSTGEIIGSLF